MYEIIINSTILTITLIATGNFVSKKLLKENSDTSLAYFGLVGIITLSILSFILNLFIPLNEIASNFIYIFLILNLFFIKNISFTKILSFAKKTSLFVIINILILSYSNYYDPDGGWYHLPFSRLINDYKIIIGSVSLHPMFGSHSILQYLAASFHNSLTTFNGVLYVNALIGTFSLLYFYQKYLSEKNFNLKIFLFIALSLFFIEMNRVSEYGNDTPAHLFFIITIFLTTNFLKSTSLKENKFKEICLFSIFTFFIKPLLIFILLIPFWIFLRKKLFTKLNFYPFFSIVILAFWLLKNVLLSGCLIYPVKQTCIENLSWYSSDPDFIIAAENSSQFSELHSKGWKNFDKNIQFFKNYDFEREKKEEYLRSFNWLKTYLEDGYYYNITKKIDYLLIFLSLIFIIFIFLSKIKNEKKGRSLIERLKNEKFIYFLNLIFLLIFIAKFPDGRYGLSFIFLFIYFIFILLLNLLNLKLNFSLTTKVTNFALIFLFVIFASKNVSRIIQKKESAFPHPEINYNLKNSIFNIENKKILNGGNIKIFFGNSEHIRFAGKNFCKYYKSPCIPNNEFINDFFIEKKNSYLILKLIDK